MLVGDASLNITSHIQGGERRWRRHVYEK